MGHEVAVFQVLTPDEVTLRLTGEVEVEDLESKQTILAGAAPCAGVPARFGEFLERWRTAARRRIDYTRAMTDAPLDDTCADSSSAPRGWTCR